MSKNKENNMEKVTRQQYRNRVFNNNRVNIWNLLLDRPYVSVALIVLAVLFIMTKWWIGLVILVLISAACILFIARKENPAGTMSIEFHLSGSKKLNMLKAIQLGAAMIMFLSTYMRQVVVINFQVLGSEDSLNILQGAAAQTHNAYATQGANAVGSLNQIMGGTLWGAYRYATNSAQFMNDTAGRWIMIWTFLLMVAPAICVLAQFFKEPYSRRALLVGSTFSVILFSLTPYVIKKWANEFAINHQINVNQINQAFSVGYMAYFAIICAVIILVIACYRSIKKDNF